MITNEFLRKLNDLSIGRGTALNPAKMYVGLMFNNNIVPAATMAECAPAEMVGNGYARQPVTYTLDSVYDTGVDNRAETATVNVNFTAAGGSIGPFTGVFIVVEGNNKAPINIPTATGLNLTTNTFTATAHGWVNGDLVTVAETSNSLPAPLTTFTKYQIMGATANTFQLTTIGGSTAIDLTTAGGTTLKISDATGILRALDSTTTTAGSASITIADGQSHTLAITLTSFR